MLAEVQRLKFLAKAHENKDIYREVDGFYYFEPNAVGHFTAQQLRWIADELDRMDAPWEKKLDEFFKNEVNVD